MLSSATPTRQVRVDVAKCQPATQSEGLMSPRAPPGTHRAAASTASTGTQARHQSQPNAIRGCCFFPLRKCIFFRCGTFLGCKAGLSLLLVFCPASAGFFLASDGLFLASDGFFSCCLQNAFYLLQRCFLLLQGVFSAALELFSRRSGFFAGVFPRCGNSFLPLQFFFLLPNVFFAFRCFFLLRTCVFRALRGDKKLENVESYIGRSPLVTWIAHGQIGDKGDQTLKQPE